MTVIKQREVVSIIDRFTRETPHGNYPWIRFFLSLIHFVLLDQIPKIKIFHIVTSEHPEMIEGRWRLIATDVIDSEEASEDGSIDNGGVASDG